MESTYAAQIASVTWIKEIHSASLDGLKHHDFRRIIFRYKLFYTINAPFLSRFLMRAEQKLFDYSLL